MVPADFDALSEDPEFFTDLGSGVWLMDDHKWAFLIWDRAKRNSEVQKFSLIHADYHWDGVNDFHGSPARTADLLSADDAGLMRIMRCDNLICFDSFIAPAVLRGIFDEIHFFCLQDDGGDVGLDEELLRDTATAQVIHENLGSLLQREFASPLIFDLCLDLFNRSKKWYEGDIWPDAEIMEVLSAIRPLVETAKLVTISMSFGYSGTENQTRHLAKLVVPTLLEWRAHL